LTLGLSAYWYGAEFFFTLPLSTREREGNRSGGILIASLIAVAALAKLNQDVCFNLRRVCRLEKSPAA